ncbi:hypothetical protein OH76DRAFT_1398079 [Lentinus brumalis]|uniref:Fungal N-terminal domain-containing protein n=1 Tax=Lentinus brumalis TaxID=2498619 RepID=A0A371DQ79_9APHY|nr:hypothetical protein OH76DRAFT_1398079 [Polyporus brumalis]
MPFPISFSSFGDIVTAVDLAMRISKALSSSCGSSYEYQYLIQELDALAHVLQLADTATRTGMLRQDVVRALVAEIGRCREVMDALWERIRGYQKALGDSSGKTVTGRTARGGGGGSSWRKIGWALFKTQDVQETRAKLATHRANLTTLMTACNLSNIDELKTQCVRFEKTMHMRLSELYSAISQLPCKIGHSDANAITLVDWRGLETTLPLHLVDYGLWQLRAMMGALSFQWPGYLRSLIDADGYELVCNDTKSLIWNEEGLADSLRPGNRIRVISMFLTSLPETWSCGSSANWHFCELCWNYSANASFLQSAPLILQYNAVAILGSSYETATCGVTTEEVFDEDDSLVYYLTWIHDPCFAGCSSSHLGVPVTILPVDALTSLDGSKARISDWSIPVVSWDEDGVAVSGRIPLNDTFPALVFT